MLFCVFCLEVYTAQATLGYREFRLISRARSMTARGERKFMSCFVSGALASRSSSFRLVRRVMGGVLALAQRETVYPCIPMLRDWRRDTGTVQGTSISNMPTYLSPLHTLVCISMFFLITVHIVALV